MKSGLSAEFCGIAFYRIGITEPRVIKLYQDSPSFIKISHFVETETETEMTKAQFVTMASLISFV
jgi:hypothetical protein